MINSNIFTHLIPVFNTQSSILCGTSFDLAKFPGILDRAKERYIHCLSHKKIKHAPSNILTHSDEYTQFLCFLASEAFKSENLELAETVNLLNRRLNSFDCYYDRNIPEIFHLEHPLGSVLGPATYSNYMVIYQGVTNGGDISENYPSFMEGVALFTKSSVIGKSAIGANCAIGSHVQIYSESVPDNTTVKNNRFTGCAMQSIRHSIIDLFFYQQ